MIRFCLVILAVGIVSSRALGQCTATSIPSSCGVTRNIQITVRRTVSLTVTPSTVSIGNPTSDDYQNGYSQGAGHSLFIKSNNSWQLSIRSTQGSFSASGGARTNKPRAELLWATGSGGPYTAMTGSTVQFASGTATAGTTVPLYYRLLWSWTLDKPGTYSLPIQITISAS